MSDSPFCRLTSWFGCGFVASDMRQNTGKSILPFKIETGVPIAKKHNCYVGAKPGPLSAALLEMGPGCSLYPATKNQCTNSFCFAKKHGFRITVRAENGAFRIHKISNTR